MDSIQADDIATEIFVDKTFDTFICRKFYADVLREDLELSEETVLAHIKEYIQDPGELDDICRRLCDLRGFPDDIKLHLSLSQYMPMFHPKACGWEIIPTSSYGQGREDAAVRARKHYHGGDKIPHLTGVMHTLTPQQQQWIDSISTLSLIQRSTTDSPSFLVGPLRFVNHHCRPNARFDVQSTSSIHAVAMKPIAPGEEITVTYAPEYFGPGNEDCKCTHCQTITETSDILSLIHKREIDHRHQEIYGQPWPSTLKPSTHERGLRSNTATGFQHPKSPKHCSRIPPRLSNLRDAQIRHNIDHSPQKTQPTTTHRPSMNTAQYVICEICDVAVPDLEQHRQNVHSALIGKKTHQQWCEKCSEWFSKPVFGRHWKTIHPGVKRTEPFVVDPVAWKVKERVRKIGKKSKLYVSSDEDDDDSNDDTDTLTTPGVPSSPSRSRSTADGEDTEFSTPRPTKRRRTTHQKTQPPGNLSLPIRLPPAQSFVDTFAQRHTTAVADVFESIHKRLETILEKKARQEAAGSHEATRVSTEFEDFVKIADNHQMARVMTAAEYTRLYKAEQLTPGANRYVFVVCTMEEARTLLQLGSPRRYILVPGAGTSRYTIDKDVFLAELSCRTTVDVQDLDEPMSLHEGQPSRVSGPEAVDQFNGEHIVNLLNLLSSRDDPFPACIANMPQYDILSRLMDTNTAGKCVLAKLRDLTSCATFQVCANANVWSPPHQDHYGLITTLLVEWGCKLWLVWPELTDEERKQWAAAGYGGCPPIPCFPILLGAGDLLIQPSQAVHAPYTVQDCLISGTQHLHSPSLDHHMAAALFERTYKNVTNEDEAQESVNKFCLILREMLKGNPRWEWPSPDGQTKFKQLLRKYCKGFKHQQSCDCDEGSCLANAYCPCRMTGQECHAGCHKARRLKLINDKKAKDAKQARKSAAKIGRGSRAAARAADKEGNSKNSDGGSSGRSTAADTGRAGADTDDPRVCDNPEWYSDLLS